MTIRVLFVTMLDTRSVRIRIQGGSRTTWSRPLGIDRDLNVHAMTNSGRACARRRRRRTRNEGQTGRDKAGPGRDPGRDRSSLATLTLMRYDHLNYNVNAMTGSASEATADREPGPVETGGMGGSLPPRERRAKPALAAIAGSCSFCDGRQLRHQLWRRLSGDGRARYRPPRGQGASGRPWRRALSSRVATRSFPSLSQGRVFCLR